MTIELKTVQYNLGGNTTSISSDVSMYFPKRVFTDFAGVFTDVTTAATDFTGADVTFVGRFINAGDNLYIGNDTVFDRVNIYTTTNTSGGTNVLEYWNGAAWTTLNARLNIGTLLLSTSGGNEFVWAMPSDWAATTVNGYNGFFVRLRKTVTSTTAGIISIITLRNNSSSPLLKQANFDFVWMSSSSDTVWTNVTDAAANALSGGNFTGTSGDNIYLGADELFNYFMIRIGGTGPSGGTRVLEYYNGSTWAALTNTRVLGPNDNLTSSNTSFGWTYDIPSDWVTLAVNGVTKYWIRLRTGTTYTTAGNYTYMTCGRMMALPTKTVTIPETISRSFKSAYIKFNCKLSGVSIDIGYLRCDLKAGVNPITNIFSDATGISNSGEQTGVALCFDATAFFNTYLTGSSFNLETYLTIVPLAPISSIQFLQAELFVTYEADSGNTRLKTVNIPINSLLWKNQNSGNSGVMWNDWNNIDKIPALDTYLPEASKVYRDVYLNLQANESTAASSNYFLRARIGSTEFKTELISDAAQNGLTLFANYDLNSNPTNVEQDILLYVGDLRNSSPPHTFNGISGYVAVTYEYDHASSTNLMNSVELPFTYDTTVTQNLMQQTADTEPTRRTLELVINENNPVLRRCTHEFGFSFNDTTTTSNLYIGTEINGDGHEGFFDWVMFDRGGVWTNITNEANNIVKTPTLAHASNVVGGTNGDILYLGDLRKWSLLSIENSGTTNQAKIWEYWNGAAWTPLHDTFNKVFIYDDSAATFTDESIDAASDTSADVLLASVFVSTNDILYLGDDVKFSNIQIVTSSTRAGGTLIWEYWDGASWADATTFIRANNSSAINLIPSQSEMFIRFTNPADWALTTVNGESKFWLRARILTTPSTPGVISWIFRTDKINAYNFGMLVYSSFVGTFDLAVPNDWAATTVNGNLGYFIRIRAISNATGTYTFAAINKLRYFELTKNGQAGLTQFKFCYCPSVNPLVKGHNYISCTVANRRASNGAYCPYGRVLLNYTSDKTVDGAYHNKTVRDLLVTSLNHSNKLGVNTAIPSLGNKWYASHFGSEMIAAHHSFGQGFIDLYVTALPSESNKSHVNVGKYAFHMISEEDTRQQFTDDYQSSLKKYQADASRIDASITRQWFVSSVIGSSVKYSWIVMPTFHNLNKVVTVSVLGYTGNGSGITITIHNSNGDKVLTTTTGVGGIATFDWYFDDEVMYAEAVQGNQYGRSATSAITSGVMKVQFKKPFGVVS